MKTKLLLRLIAFLGLFILPGFGYSQNPAGEVKPDILDSMLSIAIILFILSVITEKIVQFIRKYSSALPEKVKVSGVWENINSKDKSKEKDVEKEVMSLSIVVGIALCLIFKVDMICMIKSPDPRATLYWTSQYDCNTYEVFKFLGIIISGFFLSFGSKFFHDLIDLLLQIKNLRRKMNEKETYEVDKIEQLDEWLKQTDSEVINLVINENEEKIKSIPGIVSYGRSYFKDGNLIRLCIQIHVQEDGNKAGIPLFYAYRLSSGKEISVPVKVFVTGLPRINAAVPGSGIANASKVFGFGTLGCIVKSRISSSRYILSCYHVLKGNANWDDFEGEKRIIFVHDNAETEIGQLHMGYRTETLDVAIAKCDKNLNNSALGTLAGSYEVKHSDVLNEFSIKLKGYKTNQWMEGKVLSSSWNTTFTYPDNKLWELKDLLLLGKSISNNDFETLTQGGDSGAIVLDVNNRVIGMIVGGDDRFSYAIKIDKILNSLYVELV
jgi:hypothetical protein